MKLHALPVVAVLLASFAVSATQVVFPPLNKDTIIGTWEALSGEGLNVMVARIEISKDGPSFFAYQIVGSPTVNVFLMIGCEITDQKISLRFRGEQPAGGGSTDWFFEGTGEGEGKDGAMSGRLYTQIPPARKEKNAFFLKGPWTRAVADSSRNVEEGIRKARDEATR
jgi:hypothetical protein